MSPGNNFIYGFHGSAQGPAQTPTLSLFGGGDTQSSSGLSAAGDVNGDGYADVLYTEVSYPAEYPRLLLGGPKGLHAGVLKLKLPGQPEGSEGSEDMLFLRGAGDLNGDGFDDAFLEFSGGSGSRTLYLYQGSAAGLVNSPLSLPLPNSEVRVLPTGDVNGDGYDDLMTVRYENSSDAEASPISAQLHLGGPKGLGKKAAMSLSLAAKKSK